MKLLILTQKVDQNDAILGFFHRWIEEFSKTKNVENVIVICLEKGEFNLPENVQVFSLGKENGASRFKLLSTFYFLLFTLHKRYSHVFVHMNQEYVLLGGVFWRFLGKRILMWRNHVKGSAATWLAVILSHRVFCTSSSSYTASFQKTKLMPAGIDTDFFKPSNTVDKVKGSILFLGRIAPVKKVLEFVNWLTKLNNNGQSFTATIAGDASKNDRAYKVKIRECVTINNLDDKVKFVGAVTQKEARRLYWSHETYVNKTPSGSLDKTILEASACGIKVIVENEDLKALENMSAVEAREFVINNHSLKALVSRFFDK